VNTKTKKQRSPQRGPWPDCIANVCPHKYAEKLETNDFYAKLVAVRNCTEWRSGQLSTTLREEPGRYLNLLRAVIWLIKITPSGDNPCSHPWPLAR
jgi:hypothetical protein